VTTDMATIEKRMGGQVCYRMSDCRRSRDGG